MYVSILFARACFSRCLLGSVSESKLWLGAFVRFDLETKDCKIYSYFAVASLYELFAHPARALPGSIGCSSLVFVVGVELEYQHIFRVLDYIKLTQILEPKDDNIDYGNLLVFR